MALTTKAPFGSTGAVVKTLETYRETGFGGATIDSALVGRLGYGAEVARRVVLSLQMLELIDENGAPTEKLQAFKQAPSSEYLQFLADHLIDVYAPVFAILGNNIGSKSNAEVEDAFRPFQPNSLRKRMVALFLGLCGYVGITDQKPRLAPPRSPRAPKPKQEAPQAPTAVAEAPEAMAAAAPASLDVARARYVDLLISKASEAEPSEATELFDRIERVLRVAADEEATA